MRKDEKEFLTCLVDLCKYWANIPIDKERPTESEIEYRINGFIHSMLVMFIGCSSVNNFKYYRLYKGRSQKELGLEEYFPSRYFDIWKEIREKENKNEK